MQHDHHDPHEGAFNTDLLLDGDDDLIQFFLAPGDDPEGGGLHGSTEPTTPGHFDEMTNGMASLFADYTVKSEDLDGESLATPSTGVFYPSHGSGGGQDPNEYSLKQEPMNDEMLTNAMLDAMSSPLDVHGVDFPVGFNEPSPSQSGDPRSNYSLSPYASPGQSPAVPPPYMMPLAAAHSTDAGAMQQQQQQQGEVSNRTTAPANVKPKAASGARSVNNGRRGGGRGGGAKETTKSGRGKSATGTRGGGRGGRKSSPKSNTAASSMASRIVPTKVEGGPPLQRKLSAGGGAAGAGRQGGDGDAMMMMQMDDEDGTPESDEKRQRRLARNRESARQSRRRKKQYLELLEEKIAVLTRELDEHRRQFLHQSTRAVEQRRIESITRLSEMAAGQVDPREITRELHRSLNAHGPNSPDRRAILDYHFRQLINLIMPPYAKFLTWMMNQGDDFFEGDATKSGAPPKGVAGLWPLVSTELGLSSEQQDKLKQNYKAQDTASVSDECNMLNRCLQCLETLRKGMEARSATVQTQTEEVHKILTPEQNARYVEWMHKNQERMRRCGVEQEISLLAGMGVSGGGGVTTGGNANNVVEAKLRNAVEILKKPDAELTLADVEVLLSVSESS